MSQALSQTISSTFYKNQNSSVSSTDLVSTNRFSSVLLNHDQSPANKSISTDPETVLVSASGATPDNASMLPRKTSSTRKQNTVLSRISMFESTDSTSNTRLPPRRSFKPPSASRFQQPRPDNSTESFSFKLLKQPGTIKRVPSRRESPSTPTDRYTPETTLNTLVQSTEDTQATDLPNVSVYSAFSAPRLAKKQQTVTIAFSHDPIYKKRTLKQFTTVKEDTTKSELPVAEYSIRRSPSEANSVISEKPLVDITKSTNLSSSASIAGSFSGSMVSEKPLFDSSDITSEDDNSWKPLPKSSNSILSDSIFEGHGPIDKALDISPDGDKLPPIKTNYSTVASPLSPSDSVDQKLSEFSYLFKILEHEPIPDSYKARMIPSSLFKSNLNAPTRRSTLESAETLKISKGSNTVRFNEEITEYEHFYDEGESTDYPDTETVTSDLEKLTNEKSDTVSKEETSKYFNGSLTSSVMKKAIGATIKLPSTEKQASTSISKPSLKPYSASIKPEHAIDTLIKKEFGSLEETRVKRKSSSRSNARILSIDARHSDAPSRGKPPSEELEDNSGGSIFRRLASKKERRRSFEKRNSSDGPAETDLVSRASRPTSAQSSRLSFLSTESGLGRRFSGRFSRSKISVNSKRLGAEEGLSIQNSTISELREPIEEDLVGKSHQGPYKIRSASRSKRSLRALKNASVVSLVRSKGKKESSQEKPGSKKTEGSVFSFLVSKVASLF